LKEIENADNRDIVELEELDSPYFEKKIANQ